MAEKFGIKEIPKFETPEEEVTFLREQLEKREHELKKEGVEVAPEREKITREAVEEYAKIKPEEILPPKRIIKEEEAEAVSLRLSPEPHDSQMEELLGILLNKGLRNALTVIGKLNSPHIEDDFHRFLVQYFYATHSVPGLKQREPLFKALNMSLFEITLPEPEEDKGEFKEFIAAMEQFYAGMQAMARAGGEFVRNYYSIEIAISSEGEEILVYVAIPRDKREIFEKQVLAFYHKAQIKEVTDDYNIFNFEGASLGVVAAFEQTGILPIKTYEEFEHDPMNAILNVFSNLQRKGEGAAIQIIISPAGDRLIKQFDYALKEIKKGRQLKDLPGLGADVSAEMGAWGKQIASVTKELLFGTPQKSSEEMETEKKKEVNETVVEKITAKMKSTIVNANIRIIASAETSERAEHILSTLESAFHQFAEPKGNGFIFRRIKDKKLPQLLHDFAFRLPRENQNLALNLRELSTVFHFPMGMKATPEVKKAKASSAPAPIDIPKEGTLLGVNEYRGRETPVYMTRKDRLRHFYTIGQTGTGKTTLLINMIIQDIANGDGCCFIDPHGSDVQTILANIPEERIDDVIYFDPAYTPRPMGLNMLEIDPRYPEQKTFVIDEMMGIFNKLFDMKTTGGPMFEQYFRNSVLLVLEHLESGYTLFEIGRVLSDKAFRDLKLSHSKNQIVNQFWKNAEQTTGDQSLENFVPYITGKFDVFISNEIMRPIVAQEKSAFNFRKVMDEKKILLVNLSKGRLGEINANLIGLVLVGKILMAALSRVDIPEEERNDFYLYIDEFQNVTTPSIAQILSEARKYKLSLNIAHQFIAQLEENIKDAVFGNVGSIAAFRVGSDDAKYLESQFEPVFSARDIMNIDNFNAYLKLLLNGQPAKPFSLRALPPSKGNPDLIEPLKELSYMKYGRPREEIEEEIMARYK